MLYLYELNTAPSKKKGKKWQGLIVIGLTVLKKDACIIETKPKIYGQRILEKSHRLIFNPTQKESAIYPVFLAQSER